MHILFDMYDISINPDDNHKVISFTEDGDDVAGKFLDEQFRNDPERPPDELLRWHFRQAVLTNMKGAGEPEFEIDFPPGSDVLGEIRRGPKPEKRMGFELFDRLALLGNYSSVFKTKNSKVRRSSALKTLIVPLLRPLLKFRSHMLFPFWYFTYPQCDPLETKTKAFHLASILVRSDGFPDTQ
ncbi:hypothetical protein MMC12_004037 [Toensbergia leucococca]|nr:hypothetical protein [Toensbergia leucococca]